MEENEFIYLPKLLAVFPNYQKKQLLNTLRMLYEGDTIPFIARYRKERTGNLDEVAIKEITESYEEIEKLEKRKISVLGTIEEQGKLTEELRKEIEMAETLQVVEDLYRPYKEKRRTKATIAKEKGLEPFANLILSLPELSLDEEAKKYLSKEHELLTIESVYAEVHEILAEFYGDEAFLRDWTRRFFENKASIVSDLKNEELDDKKVFEMYYNFQEEVKKIQNHRLLALNRGEKLGILSVNLTFDETIWQEYFENKLINKNAKDQAAQLLRKAYQDAFKRFIKPQVEREIRSNLTKHAEDEAIQLFGENLRNLLLISPLKSQIVLGFDPAYRTGAKLAIVDKSGKVLATDVIYPVKPASPTEIEQAKVNLTKLIEKYQVNTVAIGNGTASRESEQFVAEVLKNIKRAVYYTIVSEAGASVYSASEIARREFPELPVEKRSAISIARRLIDPLAELVKVDPKAIGVGQYQHDVSQKRLAEQLDFVVETAVNQVGVNVNTASCELLEHVSGLNKTTSKNLLEYRRENGDFTDRTTLKKIPRLGPKAYVQAVGFLRIIDGKNPLDKTSIHPESYPIAKNLLKITRMTSSDLGTAELKNNLLKIDLKKAAEKLATGLPTLADIIASLSAPERDIREDAPKPILRSDVLSVEDLTKGMKLTGTVRNVVDFGVFVDIGVKQDGLVHISRLSKKFVKHPTDVVKVGEIVNVWVVDIEQNKGRISLTMVE